MLNSDYKEQALNDLREIDQEYAVVFKKTVSDMERLQSTRKIAVRTIQEVEKYLTRLSNMPQKYKTQLGEIKVRYVNFVNAIKDIERMNDRQYEGMTVNGFEIASILGGAGIGSLGSTTALSIAMAFGTTSTGTAIASLSGAAATNAALAWLGGGAIAAGGAGILGGQALINVIGPVGWALSGVSLATTLIKINMSNKELAEKTEESIVSIKKEMNRIRKTDTTVTMWNQETKNLSNLIIKSLNRVKMVKKRDYLAFTEKELQELGSLMNATEVLSKKISDKVEVSE